MVLVQRDTLNLHRHGGHHVRRFFIHDEVVQRLDVNGFIGNDVGSDELAAVGFVEGLHRHVLDAGELADYAFHFLQLDAEATDFHLTVLATYKLNVARRQVAHDVARTIDAVVFLALVERIGKIHLGGLFGTVEVAASHLWRGHPQLTGSTHGKPMTEFIDNIALHIALRLANRDVLAFFGHVKVGHIADGLRRAIAVGDDVIL